MNRTALQKLEEGMEALRRYDVDGLSKACRLFAYAALEPETAARALAGWAEAQAHLSWQRLMRGEACASDAASAVELAEAALARDPGSAHAHRALAAALTMFPDRAEQRRASAARAAELEPSDASNWYERWKAFGSRLDDASIRRALELDPRHVGAVHDLGVALSEAGDHESAAKLLATAVGFSPDNMTARYNLAMVLSRCGREDVAQEALRDAALRAPDDPLLKGPTPPAPSAAVLALWGPRPGA